MFFLERKMKEVNEHFFDWKERIKRKKERKERKKEKKERKKQRNKKSLKCKGLCPKDFCPSKQ